MEDFSDVEIIAPNFKRRLSGVTASIIQLVPVQHRLGQKIATLGSGLPQSLPHIHFWVLPGLWRRPRDRPRRVWHARRNIEMLPAILLRDVLRMRLKIVFTSASQRRHSAWTRFLIGRMDAVIATTRKSAAYLQVPSTTIMHGVDLERFFPAKDKAAVKATLGLPADQKVAGCFGRVRHQKGTDLFVDTMIQLLPQHPGWIAVITGRTTTAHLGFETDLRDRVARAGLSERIRFVGERPDITEWYRALDLFVAPQRWEGFGLTPLEAMATQVPVVATDVGAFSELLETGADETGILLDDISVPAMADACASFMGDPLRCARAGERGLIRARDIFSIRNEALAIGAVYEKLLSDH